MQLSIIIYDGSKALTLNICRSKMKELTKDEIDKIMQELKFGQILKLSVWQIFFKKRHEYFITEYRKGRTARSAFVSTVDYYKRKKK